VSRASCGGSSDELSVGVDMDERRADIVQPVQRVERDVSGVTDEN
jgi:hypothetical protein